MADLSGKVAVVTGASRGVGKGIAEGLAEAGATVYVTGRTESHDVPPAPRSIQATARVVDALGGQGIAVRVDHGDDEAVAALFERVRRDHGRLDVLVNNACGIPDASVHAAALMVSRRAGLIVNVSSHGADKLTRDMAQQLEPHGVAVLSLRPGIVKTEAVLDAVAAGALDVDLDRAESPRFCGRCVAALAMDPDILDKTGGAYRVGELAREYRFTDPDRAA